MTRPPVDASASEAALRYLAEKLHLEQLEHAVAVGNLAWKDRVVREHADLIQTVSDIVASLDFDFIDDALRRRKDDRAVEQRDALAHLRAAFTDTADK